MRKTLLGIGLMALLAMGACGKKNDDPFGLNNDSGGQTSGPAVSLSATLKGKVAFDGTAPTPKKISTSGDAKCNNPGLFAEDIVVSDGGLENVIIYLSSGVQGNFPTPKDAVLLDQVGCHYIPHALTLQTGQKLTIRNSDDTSHNVHAWAEVNSPFNESQSAKGIESDKTFEKEEVLFPIRCDVHSWMNAFVGVFSHPMHTVSKKGGAFEFKLPAGKYEVTALHEKLGKKTQMIEVADGASVDLNFAFKADDKPAAD